MSMLPDTPRVAGVRNNSEVFHRSFMEGTRGALATRPQKTIVESINDCMLQVRPYPGE
jgi:hypothetical protein